MTQRIHPISEPVNGMTTSEIVRELARLAGHAFEVATHDDVENEMRMLQQEFGFIGRLSDSFLTPDKRAHFSLYSDRAFTTDALRTPILEIDRRMNHLLEPIRQ
jgi:hypothetical protein